MMPPESLDRHFVRGSLGEWLRRGHPYDFAETYRTVRALYGYQTWYVNLGLWTEGATTVEPGRRLALRVAEALELPAGGHLIDAGAGLGQAAVDLAQAYDLGSVRGINVNARQVAFANELALASGQSDRVTHFVADACSGLEALPARSVDGVIAVECVGHFSHPLGFLRGVRHVLKADRRLSFCLNVAHRELSWRERTAIRAAFGFVPATRRTWEERLVESGFSSITTVDLTSQVTEALCRVVAERLARPTRELATMAWSERSAVRWLQGIVQRAVAAEHVKYLLITAVSP